MYIHTYLPAYIDTYKIHVCNQVLYILIYVCRQRCVYIYIPVTMCKYKLCIHLFIHTFTYMSHIFAVPVLQQQIITICPGWGSLGSENCKQFGQNCWRGSQVGWSPSEDRNQKYRVLKETG